MRYAIVPRVKNHSYLLNYMKLNLSPKAEFLLVSSLFCAITLLSKRISYTAHKLVCAEGYDYFTMRQDGLCLSYDQHLNCMIWDSARLNENAHYCINNTLKPEVRIKDFSTILIPAATLFCGARMASKYIFTLYQNSRSSLFSFSSNIPYIAFSSILLTGLSSYLINGFSHLLQHLSSASHEPHYFIDSDLISFILSLSCTAYGIYNGHKAAGRLTTENKENQKLSFSSIV